MVGQMNLHSEQEPYLRSAQRISETTQIECPSCGDKIADRSQSSYPFCLTCSEKNEISALLSDSRTERFMRKHRNGLRYMQCDRCSFICRPLGRLFLKHYYSHFTETFPFTKIEREFASESGPPSGTYQCDKCLRLFRRKCDLGQHLKFHEKRAFVYDLCATEFKNGLALKNHRNRHSQEPETSRMQCQMCGKNFRSKDGYRYHKRNKCIQYDCNTCKEKFTSKQTLAQPIREKNNFDLNDVDILNEVSKSMCFVCGKIIRDDNMARQMTTIHTEEKPFVCEMCGKKFKFKSTLRDHIMNKLGMRDYVCEICGREFVKQCYLNKHVRFHFVTVANEQTPNNADKKLADRTALLDEKLLECNLCGKSYPSKELLCQHQQREVICPMCDEIFASNDVLKQHVIATHSLAEYRQTANAIFSAETFFVYPCELCGRRFTNEQRYQQHIMMETRCELCNNTFGDQSELKVHIEDEHNLTEYRKVVLLCWRKRIRPGGIKSSEYSCHVRGKKLFYKRTLLLHMRMHSGLKPYKCEYCGKAYATKHSLSAQEFALLKYLKDHLSVHTQEKPFSCHHCNVGFRLRKFLFKHNRKYHSEDRTNNTVM